MKGFFTLSLLALISLNSFDAKAQERGKFMEIQINNTSNPLIDKKIQFRTSLEFVLGSDGITPESLSINLKSEAPENSKKSSLLNPGQGLLSGLVGELQEGLIEDVNVTSEILMKDLLQGEPIPACGDELTVSLPIMVSAKKVDENKIILNIHLPTDSSHSERYKILPILIKAERNAQGELKFRSFFVDGNGKEDRFARIKMAVYDPNLKLSGLLKEDDSNLSTRVTNVQLQTKDYEIVKVINLEALPEQKIK